MPKIQDLQAMANLLRRDSLEATTAAGSGHPTSCLSCAEIMSALFFSAIKEEDEFILSKGHAAPMLWSVYAEAGVVPKAELKNLRKMSSNLEGHPMPSMRLVKVATGSLGQGLSAGLGMALAKKLKKDKGKVYVLLGDGECAEGSVWEAVNLASYYKANNLITILDINSLGQSQQTMHDHQLKKYEKIFKAFGWETLVIDGHNMIAILNALKKAKSSSVPCAIIAKTKKGKGVSFLEGKEGWHGKALKEEELQKALQEIPEAKVRLSAHIQEKKFSPKVVLPEPISYKKGDVIATREAFGRALVNLGKKNPSIIALDGDVKNSTMTEYFFAEFPKRSFQCFIAEQNMVGMAVGFSGQGLVPFVATFSAFLSRAHDFIRMARYSNANIKFVGSHAGVSIGQDGPSQMGLEDLSMFLSIPHAVILYPSDAVSADALTGQLSLHQGIGYLRTTREKTPVIYDPKETFPIGKCKVLKESKNDECLVIAAGITVHEALKACEFLAKESISIRVIDLYSIMPIDKEALLKHAKDCNNKVIVVEDHYFGGIGPLVATIVGKINHLYIKEVPHSGKPSELLKRYNIDAAAITREVKKII